MELQNEIKQQPMTRERPNQKDVCVLKGVCVLVLSLPRVRQSNTIVLLNYDTPGILFSAIVVFCHYQWYLRSSDYVVVVIQYSLDCAVTAG